jgi:hypothetical protein
MWFSGIPSPPLFVSAHRDGNTCTIQWQQPFYTDGGNGFEYLVEYCRKRRSENTWDSQYIRVQSAAVTGLLLHHGDLEDENNEYNFKYRVFACSNTLTSQPSESCGIHYFLFLAVQKIHLQAR